MAARVFFCKTNTLAGFFIFEKKQHLAAKLLASIKLIWYSFVGNL
jgi:hypothetical protein